MLAPQGWCELVAEALALGPCTSVAFGRPSLASEPAPEGFDFVRTFIPDAQDTPELRAQIASHLAALAEATGASELRGLAPRFVPLPPEDYASSWKKSWKAFRCGRFAVVPPEWSGALRASDLRLVLEPGGAFGTGRHPTTRGCLRAVEERVRPGMRVLDAGCGNGVLAVAAALLGARACVGFDLDPAAIPYARQLAQGNGVAARCEWRTGGFEVLDASDGGFDGFCANLFADLIQAHAAALAAALAPRGWFAISGCLAEKRAATMLAIERARLVVEAVRTRGRWDTYVGVLARM